MKTHEEHAAASPLVTRPCTSADVLPGGLCGQCFYRVELPREVGSVARAAPHYKQGLARGTRGGFKSDFEVSREKA